MRNKLKAFGTKPRLSSWCNHKWNLAPNGSPFHCTIWYNSMTLHVSPRLTSCSPSNRRSPLPLGNPTPIQGSMIWSLGSMTPTSKKRCFRLKAGGSVLHISPISVQNFIVFGRHTSWFVAWGFESFLVSLKVGLFLCFCVALLFIASGFGGVCVSKKGVKCLG